jgi:hypothetical protein
MVAGPPGGPLPMLMGAAEMGRHPPGSPGPITLLQPARYLEAMPARVSISTSTWHTCAASRPSKSRDELQAKLADPQLYARDRAAFEKVTATLGELQLKITAAEEQWLELEILREELANN